MGGRTVFTCPDGTAINTTGYRAMCRYLESKCPNIGESAQRVLDALSGEEKQRLIRWAKNAVSERDGITYEKAIMLAAEHLRRKLREAKRPMNLEFMPSYFAKRGSASQLFDSALA